MANPVFRRPPPSTITAKALSIVVGSVMLWARYAENSYMGEQQILQALTSIGILAWPAVFAPWLGGRLFAWSRFLPGALGIVAGYWVTGQPLLVFTYYTTLFNARLLPYLGGAAAVLFVLMALVPQPADHSGLASRVNIWLPSLALVCALAWMLYMVIPVRAFSRVKPGDLSLPTLIVSETYLLSAPDQAGLVGCASDEVIVVCSPNGVLMRFPDGTAKTIDMRLDLGALEVATGGGRVHILDRTAGALHCFDSGTGDGLWIADVLGTVNQAKWSNDFGWFLDYPEDADFDPAGGEVSLTRIDLTSGTRTTWTLGPPEGWFWPEITESDLGNWYGAQLGLSGDLAFVRMGVRADLTLAVSKFGIFLAVPREGPEVSWSLMRMPEGFSDINVMGVAGEIAVNLCFRDNRLEVVARDVADGIEKWHVVVGGNGYGLNPLMVLPDRILLNWGGFHSPLETGLACLEPVTGQEMWRYQGARGWLQSIEPAGANTIVLSQDDVSLEDRRATLALLGEDGELVWTHEAKNPAYIVRIDTEKGLITLLEGANSQLPVSSGLWGTETVLRLSDGQQAAESGKGSSNEPGNRLGLEDLGSYRYLLIGNALYRSKDRFSGDYLQNQPVMRLEGIGVGIRDLARHTDCVLARPDLVVVACRVPQGVKVVVLRPAPPRQ